MRLGWIRSAACGAAVGIALTSSVAGAEAAVSPLGASPPPQFTVRGATTGKCASAYYPDCKRLRYSFPIPVTPGANYQSIAETIAKPLEDGYLVRMEANLVRADGSVPPVDVIHLHHAVWLTTGPENVLWPFYGVGEEKTPTVLPDGYGWRLHPQDTWALNFMIHNLTPKPETVYVFWDIDFVPAAAARSKGIIPVKPIAVEIRRDDRPLYPVFNVQRPYGKLNPKTGRRECTYPRDRCAAFDPFGEPQPGNGTGYDYTVPNRQAGTLVSLIGHLHPGGLRDELSLVRDVRGKRVERRIFNFEAVYYNGGDPVSWDFGITVTPPDWRIRIRAGDRLRLNSVYDAASASYYEGMGIVYGWVAPGDQSGVNPFRRSRFPRSGPLTHGHLPENDNHGGELMRPLPDNDGPLIRAIGISNFTYQHGDLSQVERRGIPRVPADGRLIFRNWDAVAGIWHTITTCKPPCTGTTGVSYPVADGRPAVDSLELGWTPPPIDVTQPTAQRADYRIEPKRDGLRAGKTYTYFCRVHPFMRGAFKVVR